MTPSQAHIPSGRLLILRLLSSFLWSPPLTWPLPTSGLTSRLPHARRPSLRTRALLCLPGPSRPFSACVRTGHLSYPGLRSRAHGPCFLSPIIFLDTASSCVHTRNTTFLDPASLTPPLPLAHAPDHSPKQGSLPCSPCAPPSSRASGSCEGSGSLQPGAAHRPRHHGRRGTSVGASGAPGARGRGSGARTGKRSRRSTARRRRKICWTRSRRFRYCPPRIACASCTLTSKARPEGRCVPQVERGREGHGNGRGNRAPALEDPPRGRGNDGRRCEAGWVGGRVGVALGSKQQGCSETSPVDRGPESAWAEGRALR